MRASGSCSRLRIPPNGTGLPEPLPWIPWLAGAGVKGGQAIGATDELGFKAVKERCHTSDLHATILHLLGIDHEKLTYFHQGADQRLTGVRGKVVEEVLA